MKERGNEKEVEKSEIRGWIQEIDGKRARGRDKNKKRVVERLKVRERKRERYEIKIINKELWGE